MGNHPAPMREEHPKTWHEAHREFVGHAQTYVIVNALLVGIWLVTSGPGGYFWPIWPILGWGVGVALHAAGTYRGTYSDRDD